MNLEDKTNSIKKLTGIQNRIDRIGIFKYYLKIFQNEINLLH